MGTTPTMACLPQGAGPRSTRKTAGEVWCNRHRGSRVMVRLTVDDLPCTQALRQAYVERAVEHPTGHLVPVTAHLGWTRPSRSTGGAHRKPAAVLEIGMAHGVSALCILAASRRSGGAPALRRSLRGPGRRAADRAPSGRAGRLSTGTPTCTAPTTWRSRPCSKRGSGWTGVHRRETHLRVRPARLLLRGQDAPGWAESWPSTTAAGAPCTASCASSPATGGTGRSTWVCREPTPAEPLYSLVKRLEGRSSHDRYFEKRGGLGARRQLLPARSEGATGTPPGRLRSVGCWRQALARPGEARDRCRCVDQPVTALLGDSALALHHRALRPIQAVGRLARPLRWRVRAEWGGTVRLPSIAAGALPVAPGVGARSGTTLGHGRRATGPRAAARWSRGARVAARPLPAARAALDPRACRRPRVGSSPGLDRAVPDRQRPGWGALPPLGFASASDRVGSGSSGTQSGRRSSSLSAVNGQGVI